MPEDQPEKKYLDIEPISRPVLVFWIAWAAMLFIVGAVTIHFRSGVLSTALAERDALLAETNTLEERAKEADRLEDEIKDFEQRKEDILEIRESRYEWGKKLNELVNSIPIYIHVTSLELTETAVPGKERKFPMLRLECLSDGPNERNLSRSFKKSKIGSNPLWDDVYDVPESPYQLVKLADGRPALKFTMTFIFWPPDVPRPHLARQRTPEQDEKKGPFVFRRMLRRDPFK